MIKRTKNYDYIFKRCEELVAFNNMIKPGHKIYCDVVFVGCLKSCFDCKHNINFLNHDWTQFRTEHITGTNYEHLDENFFCIYSAILAAARGDLSDP